MQRFHMVLEPRKNKRYRLIVIGEKKMPEIEGEQDRERKNWAFVKRVAEDPKDLREEFEPKTYPTKTRGERLEPAARPILFPPPEKQLLSLFFPEDVFCFNKRKTRGEKMAAKASAKKLASQGEIDPSGIISHRLPSGRSPAGIRDFQ